MGMRKHIKTRETSQENPDPIPVDVPVSGTRVTPSIREEMQRFIRDLVNERMAEQQGIGTFQDEDDFDIPDHEDDGDMLTNYTVNELANEPEGYDSLDGDPNQAPEETQPPSETAPPQADEDPQEPDPPPPSIPA
jgi:hypothetical protein